MEFFFKDIIEKDGKRVFAVRGQLIFTAELC